MYEKILLIIIIVVASPVLFILFLFVYTIIAPPTTPSTEEAKDLVQAVSPYYLSASVDLVYSKNYWEDFRNNKYEPRSMCFVFKYYEKDFTAFQKKYYFPIQKEEYPNFDKLSFLTTIPNDRGCAAYRSSLNINELALFKKHSNYLQSLRGSTVFVNEKDKVIMFEAYLID